ncbi:carboxypeptidase [Paenibacillus psychroresistens]|uniref:Carboxypeptidase n=1 Tax=Paenibacillus psychroresistens TaxID=1778678 RepID=A0A6B8RJ44_9BACL|nr:transglycosylase domain-containing protein [Paenibacillus psychroresistens]QGQ96481.1 carboxypeptidase [Paenibacillus psychroresistens]
MSNIQQKLIHTYKTILLFINKRKVRTITKRIALTLLLCGCLGFGLIYGYVTSLTKDEPIRSNDGIVKAIEDNDINGFVYFSDHTEVGKLLSGEDHMLTTLSDIPQQVIDATIAVEDQSFYTHNGFNIKGTLRAVKQQIGDEEVQTGGSTITQQLSRRVFLSLDQTYERKAAEILLSIRMERILSKDQILLAYLTKIYYGKGSDGNNLYGIKSAAKGIFNVDDLHNLNTAQSAYLAGLPQQPNAFSAFDSQGKQNLTAFSGAIKRQKLVLQKMLEQKKITPEQFKLADEYNIKAVLAKTKAKTYSTYPYLMTEVEQKATEILVKADHPNLKKTDKDYQKSWDEARNNLINKGYKITTTINPIIYAEMNKITSNKANFTSNDPEKGVEQVGAIMIDNRTSAILGMIEGRDFKQEQINHATQMVRQPGSAMKPIAAYLPALDAGLIQPASIIDDVPIVLADSGGKAHLPENWDGKFHGLITAREALKWSYNIPALKLFNDKVGIPTAWAFAKKVGITTITAQDAQAKTGVIGGLTYGVSVQELTNAYTSIGNQGSYNDSYLISRIENALGEVIYEHQLEPKTVFSKQTAFLMTDMMKTVVKSGTAADMKNYYEHYKQTPFVGKTGSTQEDADAWFIGYTPDVTVGVWAGYDQSKFKLTTKHCSETAGCGTTRAKKIWALIMDATADKQPKLLATEEFIKPEEIVSKTVSRYTGKLPTAEILARDDVVTDLFNLKYVPTETDDAAGMTKYIAYNGKNYRANPATPADMVGERFMVKREKPISEILNEVRAGLKLVPEDQRNSLAHYTPLDAELDGPVEIDPRVEDGKVPSTPNGINLQNTDEAVVVSFAMNPEQDVVGYRLFGSNDGVTFSAIQVKPISTQDQAQFTVTGDQKNYYMYVLSAVDIAGNESQKSEIKFNENKSVEDWFSEYFHR